MTPADIVDTLHAEGPLDTETISRRLGCTVSGARKRLLGIEAAGCITKRKVFGPRYRTGVYVWFVPGDTRLEAVVGALQSKKPHVFNNSPFR